MIAGSEKGRGDCPGPSASEAGSVTVETAGALVALTIFFTILVSGLAAFGAELALTSLARDAARAASLEADRGAAEAAVQRVVRNADGVHFSLSSEGGFVAVTVSKSFRVLRLPAPMPLSARATALMESAW